MILDISNFVYIDPKRSKQVRFRLDPEGQATIYQLVRELGFRKTKLNNQRVYFRRERNDVAPSNFLTLKNAFREWLSRKEYTNLPEGTNHHDVLEWFYVTRPLKQNTGFEGYLEDKLSEEEAHILRLKIDVDYQRDFEINQLLSKFNIWGFREATDEISSYNTSKVRLFYKHIAGNNFLVFNQVNTKGTSANGFDSWYACYSDEVNIGNQKPERLTNIRMDFKLDRDFHLIEQYIK